MVKMGTMTISGASLLLGAFILVHLENSEEQHTRGVDQIKSITEVLAVRQHHFHPIQSTVIFLIAVAASTCLLLTCWMIWRRHVVWEGLAEAGAVVLSGYIAVLAGMINSQLTNCLRMDPCPLPAVHQSEIAVDVLLLVLSAAIPLTALARLLTSGIEDGNDRPMREV